MSYRAIDVLPEELIDKIQKSVCGCSPKKPYI